MSTQLASGSEGLETEVQQLRTELARLRVFRSMAEDSLKKMGFSLVEAQKQGWVSKRAEIRRKRRERKKAAEAAQWAELEKNKAWLRKERMKIGLPVDDPMPTPTSSEAAREETAKRLRNRVRRVSHQLLLAAAIGKQYRGATTADQSGHHVPGANPSAVSPQYRSFDKRRSSSLTSTGAMARAFRGWANHKNTDRSQSQSSGSEDISSEASADDPFADDPFTDDSSSTDDNDGPGFGSTRRVGVRGSRAHPIGISDSTSGEESDGDISEDNSDVTEDDDNDGDDSGVLANLEPNDVSDKITATAYAMLVSAKHDQGNDRDWTDVLADDVRHVLASTSRHKLLSHPDPDLDLLSDSNIDVDTDTDISVLDYRDVAVDETLTEFELPSHLKRPSGRRRSQAAQPWAFKVKKIKDKKPLSGRARRASRESLRQTYAGQRRNSQRATFGRERPEGGPAFPSNRRTNQSVAPPPRQPIFYPELWRPNTKDPNDGARARTATVPGRIKSESDEKDKRIKKGHLTWAEQESKFPHLDARLRLRDVSSLTSIFDPAAVDTRVWDPISRVVAESSESGHVKREPLHLGPITLLSLSRWAASEVFPGIPIDPVQPLPEPPATEDKKRPLPPRFAQVHPSAAKRASRIIDNSVLPSPLPPPPSWIHTPTKATTPTNGETRTIASIHYPLKSPAAMSIRKIFDGQQLRLRNSNSNSNSNSNAAIPPIALRRGRYAGFFPALLNITPSPPGPPTPFPRQLVPGPDTPTVALYEVPIAAVEAREGGGGGGGALRGLGEEERQWAEWKGVGGQELIEDDDGNDGRVYMRVTPKQVDGKTGQNAHREKKRRNSGTISVGEETPVEHRADTPKVKKRRIYLPQGVGLDSSSSDLEELGDGERAESINSSSSDSGVQIFDDPVIDVTDLNPELEPEQNQAPTPGPYTVSEQIATTNPTSAPEGTDVSNTSPEELELVEPQPQVAYPSLPQEDHVIDTNTNNNNNNVDSDDNNDDDTEKLFYDSSPSPSYSSSSSSFSSLFGTHKAKSLNQAIQDQLETTTTALQDIEENVKVEIAAPRVELLDEDHDQDQDQVEQLQPQQSPDKKKSVRFELDSDSVNGEEEEESPSSGGGGPSGGMLWGARRALGRYGLTTSRLGLLGS